MDAGTEPVATPPAAEVRASEHLNVEGHCSPTSDDEDFRCGDYVVRPVTPLIFVGTSERGAVAEAQKGDAEATTSLRLFLCTLAAHVGARVFAAARDPELRRRHTRVARGESVRYSPSLRSYVWSYFTLGKSHFARLSPMFDLLGMPDGTKLTIIATSESEEMERRRPVASCSVHVRFVEPGKDWEKTGGRISSLAEVTLTSLFTVTGGRKPRASVFEEE